MPKVHDVDLCVIGAGSGGLSVAAGASMMGASVVLAEKGKMGGDCLNYGCVPSKSLLAAGHAAHAPAEAPAFGIDLDGARIDGQRVYDHVRSVIAAIAPNDSVERFEGLGVTVLRGRARFTGPTEVAVDGVRLKARRVVIATGSSPLVPPIPGLDHVPFLTNETVFDRDAVPQRLLIIGGGPIGIEMAQAHRQLGAMVTVCEMGSILPKDDAELVDVVRTRLKREGVELRENVKVVGAAAADGGGIVLTLAENGQESRIDGTHLLVAAGRRPNVDGLDLEAAGIAYSAKGIQVDAGLRTTNRKVFAIGDVAGGLQFTHVANYHASIVLKRALFRMWWAKQDTHAIPWVTYTDPELAQVGLTEAQAVERHRDIRVLRWSFHENDRAQAERRTDGVVKVITTPRGQVLGAGMVGASAGELIQPWVLAMSAGLSVSRVASMVAPYPTLGEVSKRAAGSFHTPKLFSERTKKVVRFLARFG